MLNHNSFYHHIKREFKNKTTGIEETLKDNEMPEIKKDVSEEPHDENKPNLYSSSALVERSQNIPSLDLGQREFVCCLF